MENNPKPEVLSPVGSFAMLEAAVRSGADAVYFGAKEFSARRHAENFARDELESVIGFCHIRGVKAYLTLNILLKDSELPDAFLLAQEAYNKGIDGIIIQDLGLALLLHRQIPDLPLHASTQLSIHSPAALSLLRELGFCRVVAAREMSREEMRVFCREADRLHIEVEVFVHGALCMSVSGQCLLSSFLGSRSGNRGLCAGPCRLPFAVPGGTGYDLSLKDLSLIDRLPELIEMGVCSFKIEGRMKRPEYVTAATAACRYAVDTGESDPALADMLRNVFSRSGFTDGYWTNRTGREMFGVRTKEDVLAADASFPILHSMIRTERHAVGVTADLNISAGEPLSLTLSDGANRVTVTGTVPEPAQARAADRESVRRSIDKFGATPYRLETAAVQLDEGLFVRAGELNELRRKACEALDRARAAISGRDSRETVSIPVGKPRTHDRPKRVVRFENAGQLPELPDGIDAVIWPLEQDPQVPIKLGLPLIVDVPRGITEEKTVEDRLRLFRDNGYAAALCGNLSAVALARRVGLRVIADAGLNVYNTASAAAVNGLGAEGILLSHEMLLSDAAALAAPVPKGITAYGRIPLMLLKNCPLKNGRSCADCDRDGRITDRKGISFPVRCRMGYSELLNSVPVYMADSLAGNTDFDFWLLSFTKETPDEVKKILSAFQTGAAPAGDYTRGLYFRGAL